MEEIVLKFAKSDQTHIASARCESGLLIGELSDAIWIRGISASDYNSSIARLLPSVNTYILDNNQNLFLAGNATPSLKLPEVEWIPIAEYFNIELPTAAMPASVYTNYQLKLVPSVATKEAAALRVDLKDFKKFSDSASEVRLRNLQFAVSEEEKALILGNPLPPIQGEEYWREKNVLVPAGFDFELPLFLKLVAVKMDTKNKLVVFNKNGSYESIALTHFVAASRSAIRLSKGRTDE